MLLLFLKNFKTFFAVGAKKVWFKKIDAVLFAKVSSLFLLVRNISSATEPTVVSHWFTGRGFAC
jgi:hypothetical protein